MTLIGLANALETVKYSMDEVILSVGEELTHMFIVAEGRLKVVHYQLAKKDTKVSLYARKMAPPLKKFVFNHEYPKPPPRTVREEKEYDRKATNIWQN